MTATCMQDQNILCVDLTISDERISEFPFACEHECGRERIPTLSRLFLKRLNHAPWSTSEFS